MVRKNTTNSGPFISTWVENATSKEFKNLVTKRMKNITSSVVVFRLTADAHSD